MLNIFNNLLIKSFFVFLPNFVKIIKKTKNVPNNCRYYCIILITTYQKHCNTFAKCTASKKRLYHNF